MKKIFFLLLNTLVYLICFSQSSPPPETVGNPLTTQSVNSYNGWSNSGVLTFSGTAEVQNQNQSTNIYASGGGNVYFNSTPGILFEASGFNVNVIDYEAVFVRLAFLMYNFDVANNNSNELVLEYTTNNGASYQQINYHRLGGSLFESGLWNVMEGVSSIPLPVESINIKTRFRQTSSSKEFRIDDINYGYVALLPLNIVDFSSIKKDDGITLNWTAISNSCLDNFTLEKSSDAIHFSAINTQFAKGTGLFNYTYTDAALDIINKVFYRVKIKEPNTGKITYSQIIATNISGKKNNDFIKSIYPIPAVNSVSLLLNSLTNNNSIIEIFDANGLKIISTSKVVFTGDNTITIDVSKLLTGSYVLHVSSGEQQETKKIQIHK